MSNEFKLIIRRAVETARDLEYPEEVVERIRKATTEVQITNIMAEARRAMA